MEASTSKPTTVISYPRHGRFGKGRGWELHDLSVSFHGEIVVSGFHFNGRTFIDVYSSCSKKPKLIFSEEFEGYSNNSYQNVSFCDLDSDLIAVCVADKLQLFEISSSKLSQSRSRKVQGDSRSIAATGGQIFLSFSESNSVTVFNRNLDEIKSIKLEGIEEKEYAWDMKIVKNNLFVITRVKGLGNRALSYGKESGNILVEFKNTARRNPSPQSIAVHTNSGLVAVLWNGDQIISYPISVNKPLLTFSLGYIVRRISISEKGYLVSASVAGEIQMYDQERLFGFDAMKVALNTVEDLEAEMKTKEKVSEGEKQQLRDEITDLQRSAAKLEEVESKFLQTGVTSSSEKIDESTNGIEGTEGQAGQSQHSQENIEKLTKELEEAHVRRDELTNETGILTDQLRQAYEELDWTKNVLLHTKEEMDGMRSELKKYQLDLAKEVRALKEVLNHANLTVVDIQKGAYEEKTAAVASSLRSQEIVETDSPLLAAEFGRLIVDIAENLTLNDSLQLAMLLMRPPSFIDALYHVSLSHPPGLRFLDEIRNLKIINMYDVTNLLKAVTILKFEKIKQNFLEPYQQKIAKELHEQHKAREILTWEDVDAFNGPNNNTDTPPVKDNHMPQEMDPDEGLEEPTQATSQRLDLSLRESHHHVFYIEDSVGRDGGTINLGGVSLFIPPGALSESHVIGITVENDPPFPLPREVEKARMTPLIKLEPRKLAFRKPLKLTIPHSAHILEPQTHDVVIFKGQPSSNQDEISDKITWTEARSLALQLHEKFLTVNIECSSYISASLASQTTAPPLHSLRAIPLADGVRNPDDDIFLTICFCLDNDPEYDMLLSDYKTKLLLEQYSTLQLYRHSESDEDDADFLSVNITSVNDTYEPDAEQVEKSFAVSQLCTASRGFHRVRLKKNQDIDNDVVEITVTFSQPDRTPTEVSLKARVKDLMISEESEKLRTRYQHSGKKEYDDLIAKLSSIFKVKQCRDLATYFQLTEEDTQIITSKQNPGKILMKILEEKGLIDPQKMLLFFEGLKACYLDETAEMVLEYISEISKRIQLKDQHLEEDETVGDLDPVKETRKALLLNMDKISDGLRYLMVVSIHKLLQTQSGVWGLPYHIDY